MNFMKRSQSESSLNSLESLSSFNDFTSDDAQGIDEDLSDFKQTSEVQINIDKHTGAITTPSIQTINLGQCTGTVRVDIHHNYYGPTIALKSTQEIESLPEEKQIILKSLFSILGVKLDDGSHDAKKPDSTKVLPQSSDLTEASKKLEILLNSYDDKIKEECNLTKYPSIKKSLSTGDLTQIITSDGSVYVSNSKSESSTVFVSDKTDYFSPNETKRRSTIKRRNYNKKKNCVKCLSYTTVETISNENQTIFKVKQFTKLNKGGVLKDADHKSSCLEGVFVQKYHVHLCRLGVTLISLFLILALLYMLPTIHPCPEGFEPGQPHHHGNHWWWDKLFSGNHRH